MPRINNDVIKHYRVDKTLDREMDEYIAATDMDVSRLSRLAVYEYMRNHPVKPKRGTTQDKIKPGES